MAVRIARSHSLAAAALVALACRAPPTPPQSRPQLGHVTAYTPSGPVELRVELANTEPLILRGLMDRAHLDADAGMLFMFAHDRPHPFWMKNTLIPLDMLFLGPDGTVRSIIERDPLGLDESDGGVPSTFVLEVNRGWSRMHGIKPGDRLQLATGR